MVINAEVNSTDGQINLDSSGTTSIRDSISTDGSIHIQSKEIALQSSGDLTAKGPINAKGSGMVTIEGTISTKSNILTLESDTDLSGGESLVLGAQLLADEIRLAANTGQILINVDPNNSQGSIKFQSSSTSEPFGVQLNTNITASNEIDFSQITNVIQITENVEIRNGYWLNHSWGVPLKIMEEMKILVCP